MLAADTDRDQDWPGHFWGPWDTVTGQAETPHRTSVSNAYTGASMTSGVLKVRWKEVTADDVLGSKKKMNFTCNQVLSRLFLSLYLKELKMSTSRK